MSNIEAAREYATKCHADTNHLYDGQPYTAHLEAVVGYAERYIHLANDKDTALMAAWCHDVIEDTRQTYNDVRRTTTDKVADIVFALTNEKGKTRKERANDNYYEGLKDTLDAAFVKICDRLANVRYSLETKSSMFDCYQAEQQRFKDKLYCDLYAEMFAELNHLLLTESL